MGSYQRHYKNVERLVDWDVRISDGPIEYFDPTLSYEATGYRPIDDTHGLEFNPAWFTEAAVVKKETGKYCPWKFGSKPYRDFWTEQGWRCREGYTSNGYTITGDNYYFLNFYHLLSIDVDYAGEGRSFVTPSFYVEQYKYFHYVQLCRFYNFDGCTLKSRGIGWSEINASMCANMYTWRQNSTSLVVCYDQKYVEDTIKKIFDQMDENNSNSEGGMRRLRQVKDAALRRRSSHIEYIDKQSVEKGMKSEVYGLVADKPNKIRGKRVEILLMDEGGCHAKGTEIIMADGSIKKVEDVIVGDKVMGDDGSPRTVLQLHRGIDQMYKLTQQDGSVQIVNSKHIIYGKKNNYVKHTHDDFIMTAEDFYNMIQGRYRRKDGYKLTHSDKVRFKHQEVPIDPYVFGFWLGDGDSGRGRFSTGDKKVIDYLSKYGESIGCSINIVNYSNTDKCKRISYNCGNDSSSNAFIKKLKELNVINNKHIPNCYIYNDEDTLLELLAGLVDSDGSYDKNKMRIEISQHENRKQLIDQIEFICRMLGMRIRRDTKITKDRYLNGRKVKGGEKNYRITIYYGHSKIPCKIEDKKSQERPTNIKRSYKYPLDNSFTIEKYNVDEYYGFSLDGNQLFLLKDFTVCHNSWPESQKAFTQAKELVTLQGKRIGNILFFGTGGDSGPNLEGLSEIFKKPKEFGVLGYKHNHTKSGEYCITGFFVPAWSIIRDLMDERGYVNEQEGKAYRQAVDRDPLQNNPKQLLIKCAEQCWYPEEALALEGDERFNTAMLTDQKSRITLFNKRPNEFTPRYGLLEYTFADGKIDKDSITGIEFVESNKCGPMNGVCIIEPPQRPEEKDQVYTNLYVAGIDGIDFGNDDTSATTTERSKFCIVIKKRMQGMKEPMYVAYYMGRHDNVKDDYMQALRLIQWYNAKAMIEKTRINFLSFMDGKKLKYRYMMKRPKATESDKNSRSLQSNFGAPASEQAIQHGLTLVAEFVEEYCHTIWITEMIDQLITYSYENKRKFDMVAAMQMAELADEELTSTSSIKTTDDDLKTRNTDITYVYGYYTDDRGYRRRGIIKLKDKKNDKGTYDPDLENDFIGRDGRLYSSNPIYNGMMEEEEIW